MWPVKRFKNTNPWEVAEGHCNFMEKSERLAIDQEPQIVLAAMPAIQENGSLEVQVFECVCFSIHSQG